MFWTKHISAEANKARALHMELVFPLVSVMFRNSTVCNRAEQGAQTGSWREACLDFSPGPGRTRCQFLSFTIYVYIKKG